MKVSRINSGSIMIHIEGRFDTMISDIFMENVKSFISRGINEIIVNLDLVNFIDSRGIGSILVSLKWLKKCNGNLQICNVHEPAATLIELTRLDRIVTTLESNDTSKLKTNAPLGELKNRC